MRNWITGGERWRWTPVRGPRVWVYVCGDGGVVVAIVGEERSG